MRNRQIKSTTRFAIAIGIICASLVMLATGLQIMPNPLRSEPSSRTRIANLLAAKISAYADVHQFHEIQSLLDRSVRENDALISLGIKRAESFILESGPHSKLWNAPIGGSQESQFSILISSRGKYWGDLEMYFHPVPERGFLESLVFAIPLALFLGCSVTLLTWFVLSKTLKSLGISQVVPDRVKSAFDTLAEGLMLIDKGGEIAHTNEAFGRMVRLPPEKIVGLHVDDLDWGVDTNISTSEYPWNECLTTNTPICGQIIEIKIGGAYQKYIVNATPIMGEGNKSRGVLASFDDVTALETKKSELANIVRTLRRSRDEIERQNEQLNFLANFDPMTKCMNRRAFWGQYEELWQVVEPTLLSIMMIDVDFFKAINDNYGHSVGDDVLRATGWLLQSVVGTAGDVCRYGGEEFTVLLPNMNFDAAVSIANEVLEAFRSQKLAEMEVTVSIGVSNRSMNAMDPQHMLDQADQCLYAAKKQGRDQVVRFDDCPLGFEILDDSDSDENEVSIQYSAVTGLLSALSFRCQDTAEHSLRVADLAVAIGSSMLNRRKLYTLEVCAILHDIGKIGVPDEILNKPGPLSAAEWEIMSKHDDIGVEIVRAAFATDEIANIISAHHYCYTLRHCRSSQEIYRDDIPLCSRIISVCDAFDSMVSDRVYRKGVSIDDAIAELRRCSPDQFDPEIVGIMVEHVLDNGYSTDPLTTLGNCSRSAVVIGKHIECLCEAIESEDVTMLKAAVEELKEDAVKNRLAPIADAAVRLNDAIGHDDPNLLHVLELADEVMGMCRSTRGVFVEAVDRTIVAPREKD